MDYIFQHNLIGCLMNSTGDNYRDTSSHSIHSPEVPTLCDLVAQHIVMHVEWTHCALDICPHTVFPNLLRAALLTNHDRSVAPIISKWPYHILHLEQLMNGQSPSNMSRPTSSLETSNLLEMVRLSLMQTANLVSAFVNLVKSPMSTIDTCRILDLTGFVAGEAVLLYLSASCQLIENQRFQSLMIDKVNQLCEANGHAVPYAQSGSTPSQMEETSQHDSSLNNITDKASLLLNQYPKMYLPPHRYLVRIDACVPGNEVYKSLRQALVISTRADALLCIELDRLEVSSLSGRQVIELVTVVNSTIRSLSLSLCCFDQELPQDLVKILSLFPNLTSLSLSYLTWSSSNDRIVALSKSLPLLYNLKRLDLTSTLFQGRLSEVLGAPVTYESPLSGSEEILRKNVASGLTYLNLTSCCLRKFDYDFLASEHCSQMRSSLQELILNDNIIKQRTDPVPALVACLSAGWPSLRLLDMASLDLACSDILQVSTAIARNMPQLVHLDLSVTKALSNSVSWCVDHLVSNLATLRILRLSLPPDCYHQTDEGEMDDDEDEDQASGILDLEVRQRFANRLNTTVSQHNPQLNILFVDSE